MNSKGLKLRADSLSYFILEIYIVFFLVGTRIFNTVMQGLFIGLFLITLFLMLQKPIPLTGYIKNMGTFIVFAFLSTVWASDKSSALANNMTLLRCAILGLCIYVNCTSKDKITKLLACYALGVLVLDIYCFQTLGVSGLLRIGTQDLRLGEENVAELNANFIGNANAMGVIILLYFVSEYKKKILLILPAIYVLFIALSASRSAFLVLAFGFVLFALLMNNENKKMMRMPIYIAIGIVAFVIAYNLGLLDVVIDRFVKGNNSIRIFLSGDIRSNEANIRLRLIFEALSLFIQRPVFGYGSGQFNGLMNSIFGFPYSPHNTYTQALVAYGVIGLFIWQGMYLRIINNLRRYRDDNVAMIIVVLISAWLLHDVFGHSMGDKTSYLLLALGYALINHKYREKERMCSSEQIDTEVSRA